MHEIPTLADMEVSGWRQALAHAVDAGQPLTPAGSLVGYD